MPTTNVALYPHRVAATLPEQSGQASVYGAVNRSLALVLLLVFAPLMLFIAWRIWRTDGTPVLFAHYRIGKDGRLFRCLKFRTMVRDADRVLTRLLLDDPEARKEWERSQKLRADPRVTPFGRLLRRTSLDELPQLINVLRGEMHLVGPRPIVVHELRRYGPVKYHYLSVKPGMTGLWQVSGRTETSYEERVRLDRRYVEQRSLWLDVLILVKTARVLIDRSGAF
ncbi:MAG TPA: sugar transferase [Burkholderiaceae bacterium]|nr:sugar transferase [Burkholderiaceae bacterium]